MPAATATFTAAAGGNPSPSVQWEVNTGGGFANVTDVGVYSGSGTDTLTITGATAAMSGYQYEAVFSNTASAAGDHHARQPGRSDRPERDHEPGQSDGRCGKHGDLHGRRLAVIPLPACNGRSIPAAASPT